jgi:hypothetical protein
MLLLMKIQLACLPSAKAVVLSALTQHLLLSKATLHFHSRYATLALI